jgi:hypothetical protein
MKNSSSPKLDTIINDKPPGAKRAHCQNEILLRSNPSPFPTAPLSLIRPLSEIRGSHLPLSFCQSTLRSEYRILNTYHLSPPPPSPFVFSVKFVVPNPPFCPPSFCSPAFRRPIAPPEISNLKSQISNPAPPSFCQSPLPTSCSSTFRWPPLPIRVLREIRGSHLPFPRPVVPPSGGPPLHPCPPCHPWFPSSPFRTEN